MSGGWRPILIVLAILVALGLALGIEHLFELVWVRMALVITIEVILLGAALLLRPEKDLPFLCDPAVLFVGFQAQFFVVGPLALPYSGFQSQLPIAPELMVLTVLSFIGLLAMFLVGYQLPFGTTLAGFIPRFEGRSRLSGRGAERTLLVICLALCPAYVVYQGGLVAMLNRGYGTGESAAFFIAPFLLLVLTTFLLGWRLIGSERPSRRAIASFASLLVFEIVFWGILLGQRKWLFHLFFGLAAIFLLRRGTRAIPRFVLPTVMVLLVLYLSFWGTIRGRPLATLVQENVDSRYAETDAIPHGYLDGVADPFGTACLALSIFPDIEPYRYGQTLLVAVLSPIPRAIWPTKPIGLGKELTWYLGGYYGTFYDPTKGLSITPTLVGDFHANFGVLGLLVGGLAFGIICRTVAVYAVTGLRDGLQQSPARILIPAVFLSGLVELRADSAALILFYMYTILPLLGLLTFFSFRPTEKGELLEEA